MSPLSNGGNQSSPALYVLELQQKYPCSSYFWTGITIWLENTIQNVENLTPDSDPPCPTTFDQTLWKIGISSVGTTIDEKNLIRNFENPTPDPDSPYPSTQCPTKFQSFMAYDSHLLIWCSFDPDANRQTNNLFFFIWPSLQSREYLIHNFENITTDSDSSYPITQGPTKFRTSMINYYEFLKSMFFWPLTPDLYPDLDSPTSITRGPTKFPLAMVNNYQLLNRCSFDLCANKHTHKLFFFIWPSLTVEGITIRNVWTIDFLYESLFKMCQHTIIISFVFLFYNNWDYFSILFTNSYWYWLIQNYTLQPI